MVIVIMIWPGRKPGDSGEGGGGNLYTFPIQSDSKEIKAIVAFP